MLLFILHNYEFRCKLRKRPWQHIPRRYPSNPLKLSLNERFVKYVRRSLCKTEQNRMNRMIYSFWKYTLEVLLSCLFLFPNLLI